MMGMIVGDTWRHCPLADALGQNGGGPLAGPPQFAFGPEGGPVNGHELGRDLRVKPVGHEPDEVGDEGVLPDADEQVAVEQEAYFLIPLVVSSA
jgi:hypothetical protein